MPGSNISKSYEEPFYFYNVEEFIGLRDEIDFAEIRFYPKNICDLEELIKFYYIKDEALPHYLSEFPEVDFYSDVIQQDLYYALHSAIAQYYSMPEYKELISQLYDKIIQSIPDPAYIYSSKQHFRIYFSTEDISDKVLQVIDDSLEFAYDELSNYFNSQPYSHHKNNVIDVVLRFRRGSGGTIPLGPIEISTSTEVIGEEHLDRLPSLITHELFHRFQFQYGFCPLNSCAGTFEGKWFWEGITVWSEWYVNSCLWEVHSRIDVAFEQAYRPLTEFVYETYLFWQLIYRLAVERKTDGYLIFKELLEEYGQSPDNSYQNIHKILIKVLGIFLNQSDLAALHSDYCYQLLLIPSFSTKCNNTENLNTFLYKWAVRNIADFEFKQCMVKPIQTLYYHIGKGELNNGKAVLVVTNDNIDTLKVELVHVKLKNLENSHRTRIFFTEEVGYLIPSNTSVLNDEDNMYFLLVSSITSMENQETRFKLVNQFFNL
ncbi:MAG: hypothetical protein R2730_14860 [Chitinophagales bacterium]